MTLFERHHDYSKGVVASNLLKGYLSNHVRVSKLAIYW